MGDGETRPLDVPVYRRPLTRRLSVDAEAPTPLSQEPGAPPGRDPGARNRAAREPRGERGVWAVRGPRDPVCAQAVAGRAGPGGCCPAAHTCRSPPSAPGRLPHSGRPPSLGAAEPSAALGRGREAAAPQPAGCARRRGGAAGQGEPALLPGSPPNSVTCSGFWGDSCAGGCCTGPREDGGW